MILKLRYYTVFVLGITIEHKYYILGDWHVTILLCAIDLLEELWCVPLTAAATTTTYILSMEGRWWLRFYIKYIVFGEIVCFMWNKHKRFTSSISFWDGYRSVSSEDVALWIKGVFELWNITIRVRIIFCRWKSFLLKTFLKWTKK